jgi:hypothetical protein
VPGATPADAAQASGGSAGSPQSVASADATTAGVDGAPGGTGTGGADAGSVVDGRSTGGPAEGGGYPSNDASTGPPAIVGCADGQREGFLSLQSHPAIAACAGGFALPGVLGLAGPACARGAGDDGAFPDGAGCNALDLCAAGWHLCRDAAEVASTSPTVCAGSTVAPEAAFFVTAQHGPGQGRCGTTGTNDVFGCGTLGKQPNAFCAPLDRWGGDQCSDLSPPWACSGGNTTEALHVVKPGAAVGGALCCRD